MKRNEFGFDSTDDETRTKWMKMKVLDSYGLEINSSRNIKRSLKKLKLDNTLVNKDYIILMKRFVEPELCCSLNEDGDDNDVEDEADHQFTIFLENLKAENLSYKLEISTKNGMTCVMYEEEDDSYDECGMLYPLKLKTILNRNYVEEEENKLRGNVKAAKNMRLIPSRDHRGTHGSHRMYYNMMGSGKNMRNTKEREQQNFVEGHLKSRGKKALKKILRRKVVEARKSPRRNVLKHVESTFMDMENNRGRKRRKLMMKDKETTNKPRGKRSSATRNSVFGCDLKHEENADGVEVEYWCLMKAVKNENFDVECSSDSDVFATSNASDFKEGGLNPFQTNEENDSISNGGDIDSVFRKKLIAKLLEPYDEIEYKMLWVEINEERPKVIHDDSDCSGTVAPFPDGELGPSYLATYAPLRRKILAAGQNQHKRLKFLRAFFFWLQNVAHEDAFEPWFDKSCLEVIRKNC